MKFLIFFVFLLSQILCSPPRMLQVLRILSAECNNHGSFWKNKCYCFRQYTGPTCSEKKDEISNNNSTKCDGLMNRLDDLDNISHNFYLCDDDEFPRITNNSIDDSNHTSRNWIRMHDLTKNFHIFSNETSSLDIALKDRYLLAAFVSLANRKNGSVLKNIFEDINDNQPNHLYTTRWLINGKPRLVAVDDWVPTKRGNAFSHVQADRDYWPLILEKAYAKIHGSYDIITGGWQTSVWSAITMARTFEKFHNTLNTSALFDLLSDLFQKNYTVGCEVANHAYSVLGVYEIKTDNGTNVSLVRYFNPLHAEVWKANPWGDESANWTNSVKKQVPYKNGNDGIVFSTIEDYQANFTLTNWAEIHDDYDVNFIDLAFNYDDTSSHHFEVNFTYYGDAGKDVYIFNDQNDGKSLIGCSASVTISKFVVYSQNKTVFKSNPGNIVKIANAQPGIYKASFSMKKNIKVVKSFTMTAYCQEGNVNFIPPKKNIINYLQKKQCPNNCNFHGSCNTFDGTCRCYFGYEGTDCGNIRNSICQNCPEFGICDQIFSTCLYPGLFNIGTNKYLNEGSGLYVELGNYQQMEILPIGLIYDKGSNRYLAVAQSDLKAKAIIFQNFKQNTTIPRNLLWNVTYFAQNKFIITTLLNDIYALAPADESKRLTLVPLDGNSTNQQWTLKPNPIDCEGDCNGNGVCSYSTGKCVCSSGFIGVACNITEAPIECPNNCSQNGFCDRKTGNCNCKKEFIGEACEIFYRDYVCPQNCSNQGECSLDQGKCICKPEFAGNGCESFSGAVLLNIINLNTSQLLNVDLQEKATVTLNSTIKWYLTPYHYIKDSNGKCLQITGDNITPNSRVYLSSCNSQNTADNQIWYFQSEYDYYFIRSGANSSLALTVYNATNVTNVIVDNFDSNDSRQRWNFT